MLWTFTVAGGTGLLLGLWFRVPAMIAVSGLAAACLSVTWTDLDPMSALLMTAALLGGIQFGYLAGLMLAFAWSIFATPPEHHADTWRKGQGLRPKRDIRIVRAS
jgi:hypothetical protein